MGIGVTKNITVVVDGHKHVFKTNYAGKEACENLKNAMSWTEKALVYSCYVNCEAAARTITLCMEEFFKRKDLYRNKVKMLANKSRAAMYKTLAGILSNGEEEYLDEYSNNFWLDIESDVEKLRLCVEKEMNDAGQPEARIFSFANVAYAMLQYTGITYRGVIEEIKNQYGYDFSELYKVFNPTEAFKLWDLMYEELAKRYKDFDIDLSNSKPCQEAMIVIDRKLLDTERISNYLMKAFEDISDESKERIINHSS